MNARPPPPAPLIRIGRNALGALAVALALGACTVLPPGSEQPLAPRSGVSENDAAVALQQGDLAGAARIYRELAAQAPVTGREDYLLRAARLAYQQRDFASLEQDLAGLDDNRLSAQQATEKALLEGSVALAQGRLEAALAVAPEVDPEMTLVERARVMELRADIRTELGDVSGALRLRILLEPMLPSVEAIEDNHRRIWRLLGQPGLLDLAAMRRLPHGEVFAGWVELAETVRGARLEQSSLGQAVNAWTRRYPAHPAADSFANQLLDAILADRSYPHQIALLLPLSGRLSRVSEAIRDGFLAGYFESPQSTERPDVRVYDLGPDPAAFWQTYNRALGEGAKLVVGPLSKPAVNLLAASEQLAVPVLSLNYADGAPAAPPPELYQFGLLPEDEARQAAEFIIDNGLYRAAAIVPQGAWGERLLGEFRDSLERLGGMLVDHEFYAAEKNDFSGPIQRVLSLQLSRNRERVLQRALGTDLEFQPRRREDVEAIFLAAAPKNARLLKPQLSFHHAGDIPVYATSHAFSGSRDVRADKDMDGLVYLDIPLVLDPGAQTHAVRAGFEASWPSEQRYLRLFALGMDAYKVIPHLEQLRDNPDLRLTGLTGELSMDTGRRLHRRLRWGLFEGGEPKPLTLPAAEVAEHSAISPQRP